MKQRKNFVTLCFTILKLRFRKLKRSSKKLKRRDRILKQSSTKLKQRDRFLKQSSMKLKQRDIFLKQSSTKLKRNYIFIKQRIESRKNHFFHSKVFIIVCISVFSLATIGAIESLFGNCLLFKAKRTKYFALSVK